MSSPNISRFAARFSWLWNGDAAAFRWALAIFATMRISLSLIAALALVQFPMYQDTFYNGVQPVPPGIVNALLGVWQRFDTIWYTKIAMQGYAQGDGTTVFFPLYPILTRLVGKVLWGNYLLGGIIVANGAFCLALLYLYRLSRLEFDSRVASRTVVLLAVFPTAFFFLAAYTEAPFLLFAVAAFYYSRKGNWLAASIMGMLAALTKQLGLLLLLPLLYEYLAEREFAIRSVRRDILLLALIPIGTLAFLSFRHFYIGEPFLVETYRMRWGVNASWPWNNVADSLAAIFDTERFMTLNPEDTVLRRVSYNSFDLAFVGLFLYLAIASFRRLRLSYGLYMISVLFVSLMQSFRPPYPIAALPRYVLVLFPGFMVLGTMVKSKTLHWAIVAFSTMLLALFTAMFATWRLVA